MCHTRFLKMRDPEAYEYLIWLSKRFVWPFVHGDVLKPGVEKWRRCRIWKTRKRLFDMLT